jgi:hypothetical protein
MFTDILEECAGFIFKVKETTGIISQKTAIFIVTTVRTSNPM